MHDWKNMKYIICLFAIFKIISTRFLVNRPAQLQILKKLANGLMWNAYSLDVLFVKRGVWVQLITLNKIWPGPSITNSVHENSKLRTWGEHGENMMCTQIVFCFCFDIQNNLCKKHVLLMFYSCSPHVLSLQFSCTEVVSQWTIFCHIVC